MGYWSEQPFEAMHKEMKVINNYDIIFPIINLSFNNKVQWEKVMIKDINNEDFSGRLLDFLCAYNAKHML